MERDRERAELKARVTVKHVKDVCKDRGDPLCQAGSR